MGEARAEQERLEREERERLEKEEQERKEAEERAEQERLEKEEQEREEKEAKETLESESKDSIEPKKELHKESSITELPLLKLELEKFQVILDIQYQHHLQLKKKHNLQKQVDYFQLDSIQQLIYKIFVAQQEIEHLLLLLLLDL